jgi:hypothetical protein
MLTAKCLKLRVVPCNRSRKVRSNAHHKSIKQNYIELSLTLLLRGSDDSHLGWPLKSMSDTLRVKIAVRTNHTRSEIQPQEFVLAYIVAVAGVLQQPLGDGKQEWYIKGTPHCRPSCCSGTWLIGQGYTHTQTHTHTHTHTHTRVHKTLIRNTAIGIW